jgi:hypothetical protein
MTATEILAAAEQDHLLPMDPFNCPLKPTGRTISRRQLDPLAKARQSKYDDGLRRELRGQTAQEMLERYRKDLALH